MAMDKRFWLALLLCFGAILLPRRAEAGCNTGNCKSPNVCYSGACCTPLTCSAAGVSCGSISNGCGGTLNCGTCGVGKSCYNGACCSPKTCATLGATCGSQSNGCGGTLSCGSCGAGQSCNGGTCCTPKTCAQLTNACGTVSDGCGGTVNCSCAAGQSCSNNQCCTPKTCAQLGANCGTPSDGCGNTLNCGGCSGNQVCSNFACTCQATTCAAQHKTCGTIADGCGGTLVCGPACSQCSGATGALFDPIATKTDFGPGSIVIPMDFCNNPDTTGNPGPLDNSGSCSSGTTYNCYANYTTGNVRLPFGAIYLLAYNNIPVYIALNQQKLGMGDQDFKVKPPSGAVLPTAQHLTQSGNTYVTDNLLSTGTNTQYYHGMPFVIDSTYAQQAMQVLAKFNNANNNLFAPVHLQIVNYPFTAPIISVISSRPKPVAIEEENGANPLSGFFTESGIPAVVPNGTTYVNLTGAGNNWSFPWPSAQLGPNPYCPNDVCTALNTTTTPSLRIVDAVWTDGGAMNRWPEMSTFFSNGGLLLGVGCASLWEGSAAGNTVGGLGTILPNGNGSTLAGPYCTAVAAATPAATLGDPGYNDNTPQYPASDRFLQLDQYDLFVHGAGGGDASNYLFGATPAPNVHALSEGSGYEVISGHPMIPQNGTTQQTPGNIIYIGSINSWHGGSSGKDGGLHIMYDTLLEASDGTCGPKTPLRIVELTRSSAVEDLLPNANNVLQFRIYQGSFNWFVPPDPTQMGQHFFQPDPTKYPFLTGHFREFKPAGTYTIGGSTSFSVCNPGDTNSACNWDAATRMKPFAQRNVYYAQPNNGTYNLATVSSLTGGDNTLRFISRNLDVTDSSGNATAGILGGVDWSTPAVVEGKPTGAVTVNGAQNRPTIAYVGARDGLLHAFCVQPGPGTTQCYNQFNPGDEIWSMLLPGVKTMMDAAYNGGNSMNWSKVSLGASLRVADVKDNFEPNNRAVGESPAGPVYRTILIVGTRDGNGYLDAIDISNPDPANLNRAGFMVLWEQDGTRTINGATAYQMGGTNGATISQLSNGSVAAIATSATCYGLTGCPNGVTAGLNTYLMQLSDGAIISSDQRLYSRTSLLPGVPIANDPPALPTTLDNDANGTDESVYVSDYAGRVRRFTITTTTTPPSFDSSKLITLLDASAGCNGNIACQPIATSPSIVRNSGGSLPAFGVIVASGGADWARTPASQQSYNVYAVDAGAANTTSAYFTTSFGSTTPPVSAAGGTGPAAQAVPYALRAYAQLTIAGSDLYADLTTVAVGNINQLAQPLITPGPYGTVMRFQNINTAPSATPAMAVIPAGSSYSGGMSAVLEGNTGPTDGILFMPDTTGPAQISVQQLPNGSSSLSNAAYAIVKATPSGRPFSVLTWFDSSN